MGAGLRLKYHRGGTARFEVVALEPERLLAHEARFPGARLAYEHRLAPGRRGVEVTHRVRVSGRLAGFWAAMLGRKRLGESVARFARRDRELTEPGAVAR